MNNPGEYEHPREILADAIAGELDETLAQENEVDPESYDRQEWIEAQEEVPEGFDPESVSDDAESAESDD